ncbi:hypothetical protein M8542_19625 [Amycolatopsis sp. OK19-0408]|uniref:Uncharacterized protein n=1 Tax=Amycolatopsis iheyensis TaxID=2945988 RepID=A0A9X2NA89_9PSEU|nr:hypothetical protein [Amycolatopsis iheyensis]MCR6485041.1 hypothetical protein [Amycolatopsis iheyensis]
MGSIGADTCRVLQARVQVRLAALEGVAPAAQDHGRDVVGDDVPEHRVRAPVLPVLPVVGGRAAEREVRDRQDAEAADVPGQRGDELGDLGRGAGLGHRVQLADGDVREEQRGQQRVGHAAGRHHLAVDVVGRHDRHDRLERRTRADAAGQQQLVDPRVRLADHADGPGGVRQFRGPLDDALAVGRLPRLFERPRPARQAGAADVDGDVDVAALDEVGVHAHPGVAARGVRLAQVLAVRGERQDDGERAAGRLPGRRIRRRVDVRLQHDAVVHGDADIVGDADAVARRRRRGSGGEARRGADREREQGGGAGAARHPGLLEQN